ncbi:ribosomal protection-like ABC-F family protein [Paenibacillus dakarensis]|uniref:ribosomal protection-like ABC-F family protein n=1 Tax=Paenibacillus dakarensis TaxID=1527293 RepID=UPI0006D55DDB|nr:ABC-F type ribosomal protection protein [Paenibacillus dakarensis]
MTTILKATDISIELQGVQLFSNVQLEIYEGERVALFGRNGSGKSTLLSVLTGDREPTTGRVEARIERDRFGWMKQQDGGEEYLSALETVRRSSHESLWQLKRQMTETEQLMQGDNDDEGADLLEEYGNLLDEYETKQGFQWETEVEKAMTMLGIHSELWHIPFRELSGGQKTRAYLASLLVSEPQLLILDEPTNHLDGESLEWLEQWLLAYKGTVLFVSHDREFMDKVATATCELTPDGLKRYKGGYSAYRQEKEREMREQEALNRKQELARKALEESIRRYQEWFNQAHNSAGKQNEVKITASFYKAKAKKNISRYHAKQKELERLEAEAVDKPRNDPKLNMKLGGEVLGARMLVRVEDISFGYGEQSLFKELRFQLSRHDRLAIRGPNGSGKTTLLKLLLGEIEPEQGKIVRHPAMNIGYFSQELDGLDLNVTLLDSLLALPDMTQSRARTLLGCFLFSRDDVFKKIGDLSMGEKCRAAFLKLYFSGAHLLVLDEPTNYLDVDTREVIEQVLVDYPGAIALVSHDRYLVRKLANRLLTLKKGGQPVWFDGTVEEEEEQTARSHVIRGDSQRENRRMELEFRIQELLEAIPESSEEGVRQLAEIRTLRQELEQLRG